MRSELIQSGFFRTYGCPECISNSHEGHVVASFVLQRPGTPLPPAPDGRPLGFANTFYPGTSRAQEATVVSLGSGEARTDLDVAAATHAHRHRRRPAHRARRADADTWR